MNLIKVREILQNLCNKSKGDERDALGISLLLVDLEQKYQDTHKVEHLSD